MYTKTEVMKQEAVKSNYDMLLDIVKDVVLHPQKHYWIANAPSQFDAAEYLLESHWDGLTKRLKKAVTEILVSSGKYSLSDN